ncbi:hypothetical protein EZMO1_1361 [Endozoicomonas montiporae CL-33]|uniref:Uncharacterized protein n=1 Tax=Endozoicomonas montiporae CL-33 TaxID=570277 RepID=A0A142B9X4_9GAMM|nr:hypothetical protein EZMO1_1361 [Endozoicomonas montiporae CL-33]
MIIRLLGLNTLNQVKPYNAWFSRAADGGVGWRGAAPERTGTICYVDSLLFGNNISLICVFNFMRTGVVVTFQIIFES